MSEFMKQNAEATEQYLSFLAQTQEQILDGVRKAPVYTPEIPGFAGVQAPAFAQDLPTPRELTEAAFNFTEKLIAQQKSFMERYFDVAEEKADEVESQAQSSQAKSSQVKPAAAAAPAATAASNN